MRSSWIAGSLIVLAGCASNGSNGSNGTSKTTHATAQPSQSAQSMKRDVFNQRAQEAALPILWRQDDNADGVIDPMEVSFLWGVAPDAKKEDFVSRIPAIAASLAEDSAPGDPRRAAVKKELAQSRPTLVVTDLRTATDDEKKLAAHIERIGVSIDAIYQRQLGTFDLRARVKPDDTASKMLFFRNQGPRCEAPLTQNDPACTAIEGDTKGKRSGLYPSEMLADETFCAKLAKEDNEKLRDPFTVVIRDAKTQKLASIPFNEAFKDDMNAIALELEAASKDVSDPAEAALKAYLAADAAAFKTNVWTPADEAWAKMNADNSKWYVRIAPDETYREPCNLKALFHVSFGRINQSSKKWQSKLQPLKDAMEKELATLAGAPYKERDVKFKLPDFMDVILNAGDSRMPFDAIIGQSLPNFGKVADESRGRTVAMVNFFTDKDSVDEIESQSKSLLCPKTMESYTRDPDALLAGTVLHEAAHNLGPGNQYKVGGKNDRDVFGGPLASILEEAKAETGSLFLLSWLAARSQLGAQETNQALLSCLVWGFGQISHGLYDQNKQPRTYAQLEAIQIGTLVKLGSMRWSADAIAANGADKGCFEIDFATLPGSLRTLTKELAGVKARGDKKRASELIHDFVEAGGEQKAMLDLITERMNRVPKATFFYAIDR